MGTQGAGDRPRPGQEASLLRKLIHVGMAAIPLAGWLLSFKLAAGLAALCVLGSAFIEISRRVWSWVDWLLWRALPSVFRHGEERRILGSTWFAMGALAALLLLGRDAGGLGILFLALGDPAAEVAGRRWGRPGQRKTLAGSVGCWVACLAASGIGIWMAGIGLWPALAGSAVATLVERWPPPPDDNLWVPVLSGAAVWLVTWLISG